MDRLKVIKVSGEISLINDLPTKCIAKMIYFLYSYTVLKTPIAFRNEINKILFWKKIQLQSRSVDQTIVHLL